MKFKKIIYTVFITMFLLLNACSGGNTPGNPSGNVSTNYPHLLSTPVVSFTPNGANYDVTVTLEADGPIGVYSVDLWIMSENSVAFLDLVNINGTTWSATTSVSSPLPAGNYYIESISIHDTDVFLDGTDGSSWYFTEPTLSISHYSFEQDHIATIWDPLSVEILDINFGVSDLAIVNFTLP